MTGFDESSRIEVVWKDVDFGVLDNLVRTRREFEAAREDARAAAKQAPKARSKKFDKSPW